MPGRSYLSAMMLGKCPRCREGRMFAHPFYAPFAFNKMNNTCPKCGVRLEPEPGFYQGAMYVGYGFTMFFTVLISVILYFLGYRSEWVYIGWVIGFMTLIIPLNYRYSRILFLYFFGGIKFDPDLSA